MPRPDLPGPAGASSAVDGPSRFVATHFRILVVAVLALAAFNLTFRLDEQAITEWDESLYGLSAAEMLDTGDWIATRFVGRIDYYNAKPPLNVWLIALCFKALGISPLSLRLVAVMSAWLTVLVLIIWTRRIAGPLIALVAGVVLSTSFGFIDVHSARTANTDALYALLMLLTAIVLHRSIERPWQRLWLGPLFASVFLLRGSRGADAIGDGRANRICGTVRRMGAGRPWPARRCSSRFREACGCLRAGASIGGNSSSSSGASISSLER